ncbi:hypothetical protein HUN39_09655 [Methylocystis sp. FS]|nr:hypothetical protein [Methylocystis silviterrae]
MNHDIAPKPTTLWVRALAHECAHVEALKAIDTAFPNRVLQHVIADYIEVIHKQLNEFCWDEYAASRLSAHFGSKQAAIYEGTFVSALKETRERANDHIRRYRLHNDHEAVLTDVAREYFELLRFASYLLGHLHGLGLGVTEDDAPVAHAALQDHWFAPHFIRLEQIFVTLWENFGKWGSPDDFDVIADLGMEILAEGGVHLTPLPEGGVYVHVPFSPNTLPMT